MNCAYHIHNPALVNCNSCGKPLCPSCDHRIKGFPYCQDCIVDGVEMLRHHNRSNYAPFVKKRTSPFVASALSLVCPGLGAAYIGQTTKALVHFAIFVGLFQMSVLTKGMPLFVFGALGMWLFAVVDSWRTAQMIRSGVTPDVAEDILVRRFSGNPRAWGIVLAVLGGTFLLQRLFDIGPLVRGILPLMLIGLGIYLIRGYIFKPRSPFGRAEYSGETSFSGELTRTRFDQTGFDPQAGFADRDRSGAWRGR
ncbi:MAG: B-box zinc finger protein [Pyrinomonadaceae bacterium]